ncbi:fumarylacetoacetate hydrolase family protein [Labrys monachus]|uniref:2-keto-4-pentenoate hydratase/2-oxohepta-3-ene-1,7-dioic acid hydratase in catechol pathway n=1 Tax=Labrys monachus TaxID=217067 RepID=A0ABU0FM43_9HYPH|nr:fumarylacetoacetate hydrolase family protein [Labrys monachus]MDQ0395680.1 2-keto-4-pentenoate hydratase/2-oxohepta-3-ene-1,7-dioic acid hydratase in catechol pathway [Labrys monachus]
MKLGTFERQGHRFVGVVAPGERHAFDVAAAQAATGSAPDAALRTMLDLIDAGEAGLDRVRRLAEREGAEAAFLVPLDAVAFLPPVPEPRQLREAALFPGHIRHAPIGMRRVAAFLEGRAPTPEELQPLPAVPPVFVDRPVSYFQNRLNVVGHRAVVQWPQASRVMDFELEFGLFLGRGGRNIRPAEASRCIFGYTLYNDMSARDFQLVESRSGFGPSKSKSFDGANAMGPWIVTPDEIPDPYALALEARVNGELWASGTSAGMLHSFEDLIVHFSRDETLQPGEFLASGTAAGGTGLEIGRFPQDGDMVELVADSIGTLANRLVRIRGADAAEISACAETPITLSSDV